MPEWPEHAGGMRSQLARQLSDQKSTRSSAIIKLRKEDNTEHLVSGSLFSDQNQQNTFY